MERIRINIGGSNRKLGNDINKLNKQFGKEFRYIPGTRGIGMHHSSQQGSVPDTPENRKWLKENKIPVARNQ